VEIRCFLKLERTSGFVPGFHQCAHVAVAIRLQKAVDSFHLILIIGLADGTLARPKALVYLPVYATWMSRVGDKWLDAASDAKTSEHSVCIPLGSVAILERAERRFVAVGDTIHKSQAWERVPGCNGHEPGKI
jgi:hypothetical protein